MNGACGKSSGPRRQIFAPLLNPIAISGPHAHRVSESNCVTINAMHCNYPDISRKTALPV
jgi:hypothetical protein